MKAVIATDVGVHQVPVKEHPGISGDWRFALPMPAPAVHLRAKDTCDHLAAQTSSVLTQARLAKSGPALGGRPGRRSPRCLWRYGGAWQCGRGHRQLTEWLES